MEIIFETADCEKVQATTVIFRGKAYLKINSLVKTLLHEFMAVARSGLWAPGMDPHCKTEFRGKGAWSEFLNLKRA